MKRIWSVLQNAVLCTAVAVSVTGCLFSSAKPVVTPPVRPTTIVRLEAFEGTVTTGIRVADATLTVNDQPMCVTDGNGNCDSGLYIIPAGGQVTAKVTASNYKPFEVVVTLPANRVITATLIRLGPTPRPGVVRGEGRLWTDDKGHFFPLGETLMWALRGQEKEPARLEQNLAFISKHGYDYIRILGEVGWVGDEIDPRWPDYEAQLAALIDLSYDKYALRTELTMIGGGTGVDYMDLAAKVVRVVKPRTQKVISIEVSNEFMIANQPLQLKILKYLRDNLPTVVAASSSGTELGEVPGTQFYFDNGATYGTLHLDRDTSKIEQGWRPVRQSWDFKDMGKLLSQNEPIGPLASVAMDSDPMHLAMNRAVSILNGVDAWVLHNGAGIYGQAQTHKSAGYRPPNLWEVSNIDTIMDVVRSVDKWLPDDLPNWKHFNHGWAGEPLTADSIWIDATNPHNDHGVVRHYQARSGTQFVTMLLGIKGYVNLLANQDCTVQIIDVVDGLVETKSVKSGESFKVTSHTVDANGWGGLIIKGTQF